MKAQASNILPLQQIIPLARTLAAKEAHRPDDVDDLIQVGLFAYHKAEVRHTQCGMRVERPWSLARTTLQRAIRGYYYQQREWQKRGEPNKDVGLDQVGLSARTEHKPEHLPMLIVGLNGSVDTGEQVELLEMDDYFTALERRCGRTARLMVENLLMPSGECCGRILEEVRRKQQAQESFRGRKRAVRRHQPRGVKKEIRISHRLVRDALGISPTEWVRNMERIREFTQGWLAQ